MGLKDLNLSRHPFGFQHTEHFPNGYGISVLPEQDGEHYEFAVLEHTEGRKAHLTYNSEVTSDVIRWCTREAVWELRDRVKNLPPRTVSAGALR